MVLIANWLFVSIIFLVVLFLFFRVYYYKNLADKEQRNNVTLKLTLKDAEILIKKHQIQLQRSLGNMDIVNDELVRLRNDVKAFKARNAQYRIENDRVRNKIKDLEAKIEALL
ncbi:MAG: hypothetical protein ACTTIC_08280 [Helicobacteraceae bacterium]